MPWPSWVQVPVARPWGDKPPCSHLHAQGSRSTSDVNCGPEPCQSGPALTFPISCLCRGHLSVPELSFTSRACTKACMRMTTITLRVQILTLSSLKWSPHKHIYIYKTASCLLCIQGSLRLAPNNIDELRVLGVKQCYVYTSTRDGGLYVYGHEEFVSVFTNITWRLQQACPAMMSEKLMYSLNYHAHYNLVRDLGIDWNGPHPDWWPCHVWFHSKGQLTYF